MNKSELLTEVFNQKLPIIIGNRFNSDDLIFELEKEVIHLDKIDMSCETNFTYMYFCHYFPEREDLNTKISLIEAREFFRILINSLYQDEQLKAQIL
jgi:hypothetical protein